MINSNPSQDNLLNRFEPDNNEGFIKRESIIDKINISNARNLYCQKTDLANEASVEQFFINRLLEDLGYKDNQIFPKQSIESETISKGSKKVNYKPDYIIKNNGIPLLVIDAKAPSERITDHVGQCEHYCLNLRKRDKTLKHFLLSNGHETSLYKFDEAHPVFTLKFEDFNIGVKKYEELREMLLISNLMNNSPGVTPTKEVTLKKISKEEAQKLFKNCHKYIWNTEQRGVNSAFIEFVKLIFIKLFNDRALSEQGFPLDKDDNLIVPEKSNAFSIRWIEQREGDIPNPINDIQFKDLMRKLQDDVRKNKKRILFDDDEIINLKPTTIKGVVQKLEGYYLYGIDEDLNGRLFETFLNATMRGSALGQYFTPRSIVLLGTKIADLKISQDHTDKVLDGSCGTGGFLIEALTIMRDKVRNNQSYTNEEIRLLIEYLSHHCLFGVDAAKDPKLARIARINMYLHGDGGSHIYLGDGLEKSYAVDISDSKELQYETEEMAKHFKENFFDCVLTNPPFTMWYESKNEAQAKVLAEYDLTKQTGTKKVMKRLRASTMFIERYRDLLKEGGKLITVIDDTILSSPDFKFIRKFIKENFIIRAIISLQGDAFKQSSARVKTDLVYLQKKKSVSKQQPSVFMYPSVYLGVDDLPVTTKPSKVLTARKEAESEIDTILKEFDKFQKGENTEWVVSPEILKDRLDVKYCLPSYQNRLIGKWQNEQHEIKYIYEICEPDENIIRPSDDFPEEDFRILTIQYNGRCRADEIRTGAEINYPEMKVVKTGDIVFSEYNAFNGAIGYVTEEFNGALASGSYTVVRCKNPEDSLYIWSILRTTEIKCDLLKGAVGMGRQTITWEEFKSVQIPFLNITERKKITDTILKGWEAEKIAQKSIDDIKNVLNDAFGVESESSHLRFLATKPPK